VGDSTITVSYSGSVASDWVEISSQEFTYGTGAATTWHIDTTGEADNNWGSSSTLDYPSLTPSGSHELYIGGSFDESASGTGSTSGVVYEHTWDLNQMVYDANVSAALAPTAPDSPAGGYFNVAGLISVSGTVPTTTTTNYDWNSYGQLCNVSTSGATACGLTPTSGTSYTYNGDGLRMTSATSGSATSTAWDTVGSVPLDIDDATTASEQRRLNRSRRRLRDPLQSSSRRINLECRVCSVQRVPRSNSRTTHFMVNRPSRREVM